MHNFYSIKEYNPRVITNQTKNIAFYWSPKAGCSIVAKIFLKYLNLYNDKEPVILQRDAYIAQKALRAKTVCDKCNQGNICYKNYFKIQMVRNPYSRAISSYLKYLHINTDELSLSFETYLELILTKTMKEHHMWPQYLIDIESLDYIIRFENISQDIQNLCNQHNICFEYSTQPVEPSYTRFVNNHNYNCATIPYKFIHSNKLINTTDNTIGIPEYNFFYNERCKKLVETLYGYDIEIFKYSFPYGL